jgi:hypothetical protein
MKRKPYRMLEHRFRGPCRCLAVLAFAATLAATSGSAQSALQQNRVLAAKWWKWALETPASQSPLADQTGEFAAVNQPGGNVWFLAGNQGGTTTRTVTIPAGKALFIPLANVFDVEDGTATPGGTKVFSVKNPLQVAQGIVASIIDTAYNLSCSVDGTPLAITAANKEQSTPFVLHLPADNILGVPGGVYYPAVDAGYYVLLNPLAPGQHAIHFTGGIGFFGFDLDVTYNITIK